MHTRMLLGVALIFVTFTSGSSPTSLAGQSTPRTPLFLAIPETFPVADARALVVREPGREVIVLRADQATPEALGMALGLLRRVREQPLEPGRGLMVPVTGFAVMREPEGPRRERYERALAELRARPIGRLGSLGPGRSLPFREPSR